MADGIDKKIPRRILQFKSSVNSLFFLLANDSDKAGRKIPQGIDAVELTANTDPLAYKDGTPISSTSTREAIAQGDYTKFKLSYPGNEDAILKNVWEILNSSFLGVEFPPPPPSYSSSHQ